MKKTVVLFLCVCAVTILTVYTSRTIADNHSAKVEQPLDFEKTGIIGAVHLQRVKLSMPTPQQHGVKQRTSVGKSQYQV